MPIAVLTREDVTAYAAALAPLGIDVVAMPLTRTAPAADPDALSRALADGDYAAIMVASANAARELARAVGRRASPEVWAVGPATKRALEDANITAHHPQFVDDGIDLARALVTAKSLRGQRVLVPRAEDGRTEPLDILRDAGADVVEVIAYRTVAVAHDDPALADGLDALVRGGAAVCCVFAPSQVSALAAAISARDHELAGLVTQFCAIGETTAAALRAAGIRDVAVAVSPTPEGMAQAVRTVYPGP